MEHLKTLIVAHWQGIVGIAAWALLEWALPRVKSLKANSTIELLANVAKRALLTKVPLVGKFVALLATPAPKAAPEEPKVPMLLPLLFAGALLSAGCGTAGGRAWTSCVLGKLPAAGQVAFATAQEIASNQNSTAETLTAAALTLLPGQMECGAKALLAWLESLTEPPVPENATVQRALLAAHADVTREHAIKVLREYLRGKSVSCAPVKVALLEPCADACRPVVIDDDVPGEVR